MLASGEVYMYTKVWYAAASRYCPVASLRATDFTVQRKLSSGRCAPRPGCAPSAAVPLGGMGPSGRKSTSTGALYVLKSEVV